MNTLIITNKPFAFKANNTTIVNCESRYTDANVSIRQLCPMQRLYGIRADKVIIYDTATLNIVQSFRYKEWLRGSVMNSATRSAVFVYIRNNKVVFNGLYTAFFEYVKGIHQLYKEQP